MIEALNEIVIDRDDLRNLSIYNIRNENGKTECEIIYCGSHLSTAMLSAEPYLTLNFEECKYFLIPICL